MQILKTRLQSSDDVQPGFWKKVDCYFNYCHYF